MGNIIDAISTLVKNHSVELQNSHGGKNRINELGYALEDYVKNLFADSFSCSQAERLEKWSQIFSYIGNDANPPDIMIRNGDAIEVKKIQSEDTALALNSSFPKQKLFRSNPMISQACRDSEDWFEKDLLYVVGFIKSNSISDLCMIYGRNFCASSECYERIRQRIKDGVESIEGVEFAQTRELGRINRVDPLGITYLRVRGMWHIANPWKVFEYIHHKNSRANFNFMCLIDFEKWNQLENRDKLFELHELNIESVRIKNPDNPAKLIDAKLITLEF